MTFVKGISGNPGGRPKREWTWGQVLEEVGEQVEEKSGKKFRELVSRRVWIESINGNIQAIKELFNRMDGLPQQIMNMNLEGNVKIDIDGIIGLRQTSGQTTDGSSNPV